MPQLDIDLIDDFLFFAFIALLLGFGDDESEENTIERTIEARLATFYIATRKTLHEESRLVSSAGAVVFTRLK